MINVKLSFPEAACIHQTPQTTVNLLPFSSRFANASLENNRKVGIIRQRKRKVERRRGGRVSTGGKVCVCVCAKASSVANWCV